MKVTSVLQLRYHYSDLLTWLGISRTKQGKEHFLSKKKKQSQPTKVDWTKSAAFTRDRSKKRVLTAEDIAYALGRDKEHFE